MKRITYLVLAIAFLVGVAIIFDACKKENEPDDNSPDPDMPVYSETGEAIVGPAGGTIKVVNSSSPINGVSIEIPGNALNNTTNISISHSTSISIPGCTTDNPIIELKPHGLEFDKEVTLTIPYKNIQDTSRLVVICYEKDSTRVSILPISSINTSNKTVSVTTNHFSYVVPSKQDDAIELEVELVKINDGSGNYTIGALLKILGVSEGGLETINTYGEYENAMEVLQQENQEHPTSSFNVELHDYGFFYWWSEPEVEMFLYIKKKVPSGYSLNAKIIDENGTTIKTIEDLDDKQKIDLWFSGEPLLFNFWNFEPLSNKKYYVKVRWLLNNYPSGTGYGSGVWYTDRYDFHNRIKRKKLEDMKEVQFNEIVNLYIQKKYLTGGGGGDDPPEVETYEPININCKGAEFKGNLIDEGDAPITQYGFCWSESPNPDFDDMHCNFFNPEGVEVYTYDSYGILESNVEYHIKAYAKNSYGVSYGDEFTFVTDKDEDDPEFIGNPYPEPGQTISGTVLLSHLVNDFCKMDKVTFEVSDETSYVFIGFDDEPNEYDLYSVECNTTEFSNGNHTIRATAFDDYGLTTEKTWDVIINNSGELPIVTTQIAVNITENSAISGGTVTDEGGSSVTARGVCWSTQENPTTDDYFTIDGGGYGDYTSLLTGLSPETEYYLRAYATNSYGTSYGSADAFTTLGGGNGETFTDPRDGQTYNIVAIGTQIWFSENLNYEIGNSWCYENQSNNCDEYGRLYDWGTAMDACPEDWHLPSDDEWKILEMHLGMSQSEADNTGWRGTDEGIKLKSISGWDNNGNGTNSSGFDALPGGARNLYEEFVSLGIACTIWSSTEGSSSRAWRRDLYGDNNQVYRYNASKGNLQSVRCIKDE